jgi:hypothetical protein
MYAEEFISQDGIQLVLKQCREGSLNTQGYALAALRECMSYVSGMQTMIDEPDLIGELYEMVGLPYWGVDQ